MPTQEGVKMGSGISVLQYKVQFFFMREMVLTVLTVKLKALNGNEHVFWKSSSAKLSFPRSVFISRTQDLAQLRARVGEIPFLFKFKVLYSSPNYHCLER